MNDWQQAALALAALLIGLFVIGRSVERRHFRALALRERACRDVLTVNVRQTPPGWVAEQGQLLMGNAVVSLDYFKRFAAGWKALLGGRLRAYEPLLERGRREALLRLREAARQTGHDGVINVRLQTATLANTQGREGTGGVEVLAYGTAVRLRPAPASR